ncbi:hypothetical protein [uncultured Novosphingobium sp.]|uniref:hypothetical protein n=1 Tax=uncultured Novosphingobium sp. TaxID=292277 RepID=UPI002584210D|nr:hypothetical protein [uncultured Novosphingobium sp.]
MGDADRMVHYGGVCIDILIDIYAAHELDELAGLRALVRALGIDRLANQMDRHRIISHFRCVIIPSFDAMGKNYLASHMRVNSMSSVERADGFRTSARSLDYHAAITARSQPYDG